jgi:MSHA biogenesis protein MshJ
VADFKPWLERIDSLSLKERVLLLGATVLVLLKICDALLLRPIEAERARLEGEVATLSQNLRETHLLADSVVNAARDNPDATVEAAIARRRSELTTLDQDVQAKIGNMVPSERMAEVLSAVLRRFDKLQFVALEGLGAEPIAMPAAQAGDAPTGDTDKSQAGAYRHGIRIRFKGSYFDTLAYLRALEALPWGFFWDRIELETKDYPNTEGAIVVYTVSLSRHWIGV